MDTTINMDGADYGYDAALAVVIPFVASVANQYNWPSKYKAILAVVLCILAALGQAYIAGKFDLNHIFPSLIYIVILSEVIYQRFKTQFKALEAATTPSLTKDTTDGTTNN